MRVFGEIVEVRIASNPVVNHAASDAVRGSLPSREKTSAIRFSSMLARKIGITFASVQATRTHPSAHG